MAALQSAGVKVIQENAPACEVLVKLMELEHSVTTGDVFTAVQHSSCSLHILNTNMGSLQENVSLIRRDLRQVNERLKEVEDRRRSESAGSRAILCLDATKAFDRIEWRYLWEAGDLTDINIRRCETSRAAPDGLTLLKLLSLLTRMSVELIFVAFLEHQKTVDVEFKAELQLLVRSLNQDGELETDSHGGVSFHCAEMSVGPQHVVDEDLCRRIGAQLAEMGDRFQKEGRIKTEVVESLVHDILNESLTEDRFEDAVKSLLNNLPPGTEMEQATLVVAMSLTSKVGSSVPDLLQNCFTTALTFIQRNYRSYIECLTSQGAH
ncbi:uncharacterized protein LOC122926099 [Bufo gargarizans]|uniref:uncharacterized protein LOC122926099 n=1 Tax=Bufo gargarizans TaxID=30331 RepID=UPI001CF30258|nr:uncharacterized protein LOC122926099 [Bufo gargarizans]